MMPSYSFDLPNYAGETVHVEVAADDEDTALAAATAALSTVPAPDPHLFEFRRPDGETVTIGVNPKLSREKARKAVLSENAEMIEADGLELQES